MERIKEREFIEAFAIVKKYIAQLEEDSKPKSYEGLANVPLKESILSTRVLNVLGALTPERSWGEPTIPSIKKGEAKIYHLSLFSRKELLQFRNMGKVNLKEIENLLICANLKLKEDD